jgi:hypothetical protein
MRTLIIHHRLLVGLALLSLILSLPQQISGGIGMATQMTMGQTATLEMPADLCEGCGDLDALNTDCINIQFSCAQVPAPVMVAAGLSPLRPVSAQRARDPHFHPGLSPAPELQPPRGLLQV